jgi:hypothetical protein
VGERPTWMERGACEFEAHRAVAAMHASVYGLASAMFVATELVSAP